MLGGRSGYGGSESEADKYGWSESRADMDGQKGGQMDCQRVGHILMVREWDRHGWSEIREDNNNNNNNNIYLTAIGLSPGGSGYLTCIQI
jgi:hypothetical protein